MTLGRLVFLILGVRLSYS